MELRPTHEVMKDTVDKVGVKKIAGVLGVSTSLVYKWCQAPKTGKTEDASGAANPLDRLLSVFELTDDLDVIHYICRYAEGYYTPNPLAKSSAEIKFISETVAILNKFADLMHYAERSLSDDGKIDKDESIQIRRDWDKLKSHLEHFVGACEAGVFDMNKDD